MTSKDFYKTYQADDHMSELSLELCRAIRREEPNHALEFGMGSGKHMRYLRSWRIATVGIDISILNCIRAQSELGGGIMLGDENYLRHFVNFDVVFTVSVLDHIEDVSGIIEEFKRIANRAVYLAETNDELGEFYFPHDYEAMGFVKLPFEWQSTEGDGGTYYIWKFTK